MKGLNITLIAFVALGLSWGSSVASAQGFSSILEKLDALQERLEEVEATQKTDIEALQDQLSNNQAGSEVPGLTHSVGVLRSQVDHLTEEVEQIQADTSRQENEAVVGALTGELRELTDQLREGLQVSRSESDALASVDSSQSIPSQEEHKSKIPTASLGKISGYMFADYYYLANASGNSISAAKGAKSQKNNGFAFRRIYFEYNRKLEKAWAIRLRMEANDTGFGSSNKMVPFVKHAYLKYTRAGRATYIGLSGTPTWSVSEKTWGYRSIEKTIMDLHKIGSSADLGFAFKGKIDAAGRFNLYVMLGNGPGQKPEKDNHKKLYLQLSAKPTAALTVVGYTDWESQPADQDQVTLAGFVGLDQSRFRGGLEGFLRVNKQALAGEDVQVRGISLFGSVKGSSRVRAFGRFDLFDPSDQTTDDQEYLVTAGIDFTPQKDFHLMPNLWIQAYQASAMETDIVPRMTFYFKF